MNKQIRDLPKEIQEIVFQRQSDAGNTPNAFFDLGANATQGSFTWYKTPEGNDFWYEINRGNYEIFYKLYPSKPMQSSQAITKRSLIEIYLLVSCNAFRDVIRSYIGIATLKFDEDLINISDDDINRLYKEGNEQQIKLCEAHGIKRPESELPKSWEDLGKIDGFKVNLQKGAQWITGYGVFTKDNTNRDFWPSKELAQASVALAQLLQIQKVWRKGWVPDWNDENWKHVVCVRKNKLTTDVFQSLEFKICFETQGLRNKFLDTPKIRELLEIAKPLL